MKFPISIVIICTIMCIVFSCRTGTRKNKASNVKYYGNVDSIMTGHYPAVFHMDSLLNKENIYAIGAMEGLVGEIQVFNGSAFNSSVRDDSVVVGLSRTTNASLLIYAQVANWREINMPLSVVNQEALIGFLEYDEQISKMSSGDPLVFTIEGKAEQINWHVVNGPIADSTSKTGHKIAKVSDVIEDVEVEILGFYSREHEGIITHRNIPIHMHFKTADGSLAGHVDDLELGPEMTMQIPKSK